MQLQFPYLTACIDESLRVHPPAGTGTLRTAREDCTVCGFRIPKGTLMNVRCPHHFFPRNTQEHYYNLTHIVGVLPRTSSPYTSLIGFFSPALAAICFALPS